ncbi:MAG: CBS domain-containing protein [Bdellovibrionales bacterium]
MSLSIKQRMSRYPFISEMNMSVSNAIELMHNCKIRHLPVIANDLIIGVVSERDLIGAMGRDGSGKSTVADCMTKNPYTVDPTTPLEVVVSHMARCKIGCALISNPKHQILGIFTTTDALILLAELLGEDDSSFKGFPVEMYMTRLEAISV